MDGQIIAVLNLSKRLHPNEVAAMVDACSRQQAEDVCPAWGVPYRPINVYDDVSKLPPLTTDIIPIIDEPGDPGVLGFHSMGIAPFGRVFVNPILDNGGCVLFDPGDPSRMSVASVLSHEAAIELPIDPGCDRFALDEQGNEWDLEAADMVQRTQYVRLARMPWGDVEVAVSDFVLPAFFKAGSAGPWNFLNVNGVSALPGPFTIAPGGYAMVNGQATYARRLGARGENNFASIYPPAWLMAHRPPGSRRVLHRERRLFVPGVAP